jgi:hypothetical protein
MNNMLEEISNQILLLYATAVMELETLSMDGLKATE